MTIEADEAFAKEIAEEALARTIIEAATILDDRDRPKPFAIPVIHRPSKHKRQRKA